MASDHYPTILTERPRTMWQAAKDMFEEAHRRRDEGMWDRAYRLWMQACFANAPGEAYALLSLRPLWLPTTVSEDAAP